MLKNIQGEKTLGSHSGLLDFEEFSYLYLFLDFDEKKKKKEKKAAKE